MRIPLLVHAKPGYRPRLGWRLLDGHLIDPRGVCRSCGRPHREEDR